MPASPVLTARLAMLATLTALVVEIAAHGRAADMAVVVLVVVALLAAAACLDLARHRPRTVPVLAAAPCLGVAYPVWSLHSLPADSAAIPLGEVGGLLLSLAVLVTTFLLLPGSSSRPTDAGRPVRSAPGRGPVRR